MLSTLSVCVPAIICKQRFGKLSRGNEYTQNNRRTFGLGVL